MHFWRQFFGKPFRTFDANDGGAGGAGGANGDAGAGGGSGGGAGDGGQGGNAGGGAGSGEGGEGGQNKPDVVTMSQKELDDLIEGRLGRAKKKWDSDAEEARKKAEMTDSERLKAEKEEADKASKDTVQKAADKVRRSEARARLASAGVSPERVDRAVKLLDLADIDVNDDLDVDEKSLKKAIDDLLKEWPELVGSGGNSAGGSDFIGGGGGRGKISNEDFAKMSLKEKQELYQKDPVSYKVLMDQYKKR